MTAHPTLDRRIIAAAGLAAALGATLVAGPAAAADEHAAGAGPRPAGAVFVQLNQPEGNAVAAFTRDADGSLTPAGTYPTGGLGGIAEAAPFDALASQGSLTLSGDRDTLLAVNAGSDTVTSFSVSRRSVLTREATVPSGGLFPVGVAEHDGLVYVLNGGGSGSVSGYRLVGSTLRPIPNSTRDLGLANADVPNFLTSPGQVGFSADGRHLVITTKLNGTLLTFDVGRNGRLSATPEVTDSPGPVPFSFDLDRTGRLHVTQAGGGTIETYAFDRDGDLALQSVSASGGGAAMCWNVVVGRTVYGVNSGSDTISSWQLARRGAPQLSEAVAAEPGSAPVDIDATRDDRYVYVLNAVDGTVTGYAVDGDGSLDEVERQDGIPPFQLGVSGAEGLVAI